ncbi:hypothetical protein ACFQL1_13265 [Halomicroarcula sp. GCM10025709]|uniref:DUF7860 family protein n=1 Tax=Haloarcula TaxID=2237 RepID=UPI0024C3C133|nr:hypothetical protein [Halomicroarcula sp. YJ-61-S]
MGQTQSMDHATMAKRGFFLGVGLFVVGVLGETVGQAVAGPLPGWEHLLLTNMEGLGILIGLLSPLVFGIVLPLTE